MIIRLFSFSKRSNSTARPATTGSEQEVKLKDGTSILRPSFLLQADPVAADWYEYNYIYVPAWSRYYHVLNIESVRNDLWRIDCDVDVLASFKAEIQQTTAFVAYSSSFGNAQIVDGRLSVTTPKTVVQQIASFDKFGLVTSSNKAVVLTVTGQNSVGHYVMPPAVASNLLNSIDAWMDQTDILPFTPGQGLSAVIDGLQYIGDCLIRFARQFVATGNAAENITNAIAVPVIYSYPSGTIQEIKLGKFETGIQATYIPESSGYRYMTETVSLPIPWQTADFRRQAPYTNIALYLPFIGYVNISPAAIMGDVSLSVQANLDIFSGDTIFRIYGIPDTLQNAHLVAQYSTNTAASFAIGRSSQTPLQVGTNLLQAGTTVAAAAATGGASAAIAGGSGAIAGIIGALEAQPTCISSGGGSVAMGFGDSSVCRLILTYHDTNVAPSNVNSTIGRPTMEALTMSALSGYVETRCFSVSGDMTETERERINQMLDGGIYIE